MLFKSVICPAYCLVCLMFIFYCLMSVSCHVSYPPQFVYEHLLLLESLSTPVKSDRLLL